MSHAHAAGLLGLTAMALVAMAAAAPAATQIDAKGPPSQTVGVAIPAGQIDQAVRRLDGLAAAILRKSAIPGLAVAVVRDGRVVYAKGFGVRKAGEAARVDADTVFQLASVSKPLGATVVAQQVGRASWPGPRRSCSICRGSR